MRWKDEANQASDMTNVSDALNINNLKKEVSMSVKAAFMYIAPENDYIVGGVQLNAPLRRARYAAISTLTHHKSKIVALLRQGDITKLNKKFITSRFCFNLK